MATVLNWFGAAANMLIHIGYPGMFAAMMIESLGLPFPGDAFLLFYGFSCAEGRFPLLPVFMTCWLAFCVGSGCAYLLSRHAGEALLRRQPERIADKTRGIGHAMAYIQRYGPALLVPGRLLPGIRSVSSYAAGLSGIGPLHFFAYTAIGGGLYVALWLFGGYFFGDAMRQILHAADGPILYMALVAIGILLLSWIRRRRRTKT